MDWECFPHCWSLVRSTDVFPSTKGAICRSLMSSFLLSYKRNSRRNSWVAFDSKRYDVRGVNVEMYFCYPQLSGTEHRKNCAHVSRFVVFACVLLSVHCTHVFQEFLWRRQMEIFSALLAICERNPAVTGGHAFQLQRSCRKINDEIPYLKYVANDKYATIENIQDMY